jgi:hypothetical protein
MPYYLCVASLTLRPAASGSPELSEENCASERVSGGTMSGPGYGPNPEASCSLASRDTGSRLKSIRENSFGVGIFSPMLSLPRFPPRSAVLLSPKIPNNQKWPAPHPHTPAPLRLEDRSPRVALGSPSNPTIACAKLARNCFAPSVFC